MIGSLQLSKWLAGGLGHMPRRVEGLIYILVFLWEEDLSIHHQCCFKEYTLTFKLILIIKSRKSDYILFERRQFGLIQLS